ncbi:hypothetical protein [Nocardia sp. IFM 10818]
MAEREPPAGPGFVVFTICWLVVLVIVPYSIAASVREGGGGSTAVLLTWLVVALVLVGLYYGITYVYLAEVDPKPTEVCEDDEEDEGG